MAVPLITVLLSCVLAAPSPAAPGRTAAVEVAPQAGSGSGSAGAVKIAPAHVSLTAAPLSPILGSAPPASAPDVRLQVAPAASLSAPAAYVAPAAAPSLPADSPSPVDDILSEAGLGAADPSVSPTLRASRERAGSIIRTARGLWTSRELRELALEEPEDIASSGARLRSATLRAQAAAVRTAAGGARLERSPLQALYVRPFLRRQADTLEAAAAAIDKHGLDTEAFLARVAATLDPARRAALTDIKRYVPGLDLARVAYGWGEFMGFGGTGIVPGGYSTKHLPDPKGLVWIGPWQGRAFIHIAVHEGIHQGDGGYAVGERALSVMYGERAGAALASALIEGYTEMRAQETLEAMLRDARVGAAGAPKLLLESFQGRDAREAEENYRKWRASPEVGASYQSYVEMALEIAALPRGRAALEAFVGTGDVAPLYAVMGERRLRLLASAAHNAASFADSKYPLYARLGARTGLRRWADGRLVEVVRGAIRRDAQLDEADGQARLLLRLLWDTVLSAPWVRQPRVLRALERLRIDALLAAGESPQDIRARIEEAARLSQPRDWLPLREWGRLPVGVVALFAPAAVVLFALVGSGAFGVPPGGSYLLLALLIAAALWPAWSDYRRLKRYWAYRLNELISGV